MSDPLVLGRPAIAKQLGICVSTLKKWHHNPASPVGRYLSRVGGRVASTERELSHLKDELIAQGRTK
jgi:hypothetical protein